MEYTDKNPNPTKDQHFMIDPKILELIYNTANIQEGESVVEIGGGEGALTDYLAQNGNNVTVIEKDPYYAEYLRNRYKNCSNVQIIEDDALNFDFSSYDRLVSNLPYTITEPILINLASSGALDYNPGDPKFSMLKTITLVLSQNSVRKMVAPVQIAEGKNRYFNKEFGLMGAICKAFCDIEIVRAIPSDAFFPAPAVTSFIINLTPKKEKTTIDRIVRELLIDKKGTHSSIKRIYQLMIVQGKVYKMSKHKNSSININSFTSSSIENQNIYDLNNAQLSKLFQDLINNDISMKSKATSSRNEEKDIFNYFVGGKFIYSKEDDSSEDAYNEDDVEEEQRYRAKEKHEKKYDYMYDSRQYEVLLNRGLEFVDPAELSIMLGGNPEDNGIKFGR